MIWLLLGCFSYRLREDKTTHLDSVRITSESGFYYHDEVLTCEAELRSNFDDPPVYYAWYSEGGAFDTGDRTSLADTEALDLSTLSFMPGDSLLCEVEIEEYFDLHWHGGASAHYAMMDDTVMIGNQEPVIESITINEQEPEADSVVSCLVTASDPEGGEVTTEYEWSVDGTVVLQAAQISLTPSIAPVGGMLQCEAMVSDPHGGAVSAREEVTIQNTAPEVVQAAEILPASDVDITTLLTCTASGSDLNDEEVSLSYLWKNGQVELGTDSSLQLTPQIVSSEDTVSCIVTIADSNGGTVETTASTPIQDSSKK